MEFFDNIAYIVALALSVLNAIITFVRTGTLKKEYKQMVYRSPDYQKNGSQKQSFDNLKTEYILNERTNELEEKEEKTDLQSLINSSIDSALDRVLQRLIPQGDVIDDLESESTDLSDDLMDFAEILDRAEDYRERFNLPLTASTADIFKRVQEESDALKKRLDDLKQPKQPKQQPPIEAKETIKDESQKDDK